MEGVIAQKSDDGKIVVEITKDINGEKKTFKGEYNSTEEMHADPNFKEFSGDREGFDFWFDNSGDEDVFFHRDQLKGQKNSFFKYFHGDEDDGEPNTFFFKHLDGDSINEFLNLHLDNMDLDDYQTHMKGLGIEIEEMLKRLNDGTSRQIKVISISTVKITDVADEFGKKGKVDKNSELKLEDLTFYPNPSSNGRFRVRFTTENEGDLSIKVTNLEGKEVYGRFFENFNGLYSEMIDLSGHKEGIYLLEITQSKKRLTKKIIIN